MIAVISPAIEWMRTHPALMWWSGALSLVMFVGTLVVVPVLLVKMPADYFVKPRGRDPDDWRGEHPVLRWAGLIGKNLLGVALMLMGIALLILPGQGLLTILLGVTLLDLPGKRQLEIALLKQRGVARAVNWLRRRYQQEPLEMPAESTTST